MTDDVYVRAARADDLDDLVRLRQENGRVHAELEPEVYRIPDADAVHQHFRELLQVVPDLGVVLVAEDAEGVAGLVEVLPYPEPPAHQILQPCQRRAKTDPLLLFEC